MKIEVKGNVFWDDELIEQSEEAVVWMAEEALPKRTEIVPENDFYSRPYKWVIDMNTCFVIIIREYIHQNHSWAMKGEKVLVTLNNE